jgi:hypothetical protein
VRDRDCVLVALAGAGAVEVLVCGHVCCCLCRCRGVGFGLDELILADIICLGAACRGRVEVKFFVQVYGCVRVWW